MTFLERLLIDRGLTQRELADQTGVDRSHLSRVVRGEYIPSAPVAKKLGDALGILPSDLVARLRAEARGATAVPPAAPAPPREAA